MIYSDIKELLEKDNITAEFVGDLSSEFKNFVEYKTVESYDDYIIYIYASDLSGYQNLLDEQKKKNFLLITNQYFEGIANQVVVKDSKHIYHHIRTSFLQTKQEEYIISDKAIVNCEIDSNNNISIGHFSIIDEDVVIGNNVRIGANVIIKNGTVIKDNVFIGDNTNIGFDAYAFYELNGVKKKIVSVGGVIIEEDVHISPGCIINKGITLNTVIGQGSKLDSFIFVGHDCTIGKNNVFPCGGILGGYSKIGDNNYFGLNSTLKNQVIIGNDNLFGMGSVIVSDFDDSNVAFGNPAKTKRRK